MRTKILILVLLSVSSLNSLYAHKQPGYYIVSGYVTDIFQNPVGNALILIDNVKSGYTSDKKGYYKIRIKPGAGKIAVVEPDLGRMEQSIDGRRRINFTYEDSKNNRMMNNSNAMSKEYFMGYNDNLREQVTSEKRIEGTRKDHSSYNSIYDLIRSEFPGVRVYGRNIRVNYCDSFLAGTEPLYIVDGATVRSISSVSPQIVETVEVLKGPSAAIYGARGANGVVLINTRLH